MSDVSTVACEIMATLPLYRDALFTMEQAVVLAKSHAPGEAAGFIESVAKEILRMDRLEQGTMPWCEPCQSYHNEAVKACKARAWINEGGTVYTMAGIPVARVYQQQHADVMAASRELLDVVRQFVADFEAAAAYFGLPNPGNANLKAARAAIAKAEGRS